MIQAVSRVYHLIYLNETLNKIVIWVDILTEYKFCIKNRFPPKWNSTIPHMATGSFDKKKHNCPHNVKAVVQTVIILDTVAHNALLT